MEQGTGRLVGGGDHRLYQVPGALAKSGGFLRLAGWDAAGPDTLQGCPSSPSLLLIQVQNLPPGQFAPSGPLAPLHHCSVQESGGIGGDGSVNRCELF